VFLDGGDVLGVSLLLSLTQCGQVLRLVRMTQGGAQHVLMLLLYKATSKKMYDNQREYITINKKNMTISVFRMEQILPKPKQGMTKGHMFLLYKPTSKKMYYNHREYMTHQTIIWDFRVSGFRVEILLHESSTEPD
jgi:hypothetical protein